MDQTEQDILDGAAARIEHHRKADCVVTVVDQSGKPIPGIAVRVEQRSHAFLFGANAFLLKTYPDPAMEKAYESQFSALFNYATLRFQWGAHPSEDGPDNDPERLREQARWCRDHGIQPKGFPLVWHLLFPPGVASEATEARERLQTRVADLVSDFAGVVDRWDAVNEVSAANSETGVTRWIRHVGAAAVTTEALSWARAANPSAVLTYNDYSYTPDFERLVSDLVTQGAALDAVGCESHMHGGDWPLARIWSICQTCGRFGLPVHFTEITSISGEFGRKAEPWPSTPEDEKRQAEYVALLYITLFSHPSIGAISWWDFVDGGWLGAPGGLLRADLTPKPAYSRLLDLIRREWWTRESLITGTAGQARFRGFLGGYRFSASSTGGEVTVEGSLARQAENRVTLTLG